MIHEIEVPDGHDYFVYLTKTEDTPIATECFASRVAVELDEDENPTRTDNERARLAITRILDRQIVKFQRNKAADAADIKTNVII
jgi:hypothetical protein